MESNLIVGGDSFIGKSLSVYLANLQKKVTLTTRRRDQLAANTIFCDLSESADLSNFNYHDAAVLCAGITNMSYCEANPQISRDINVTATVAIAKKLLSLGTRVVFISSNTVFDGTVDAPAENISQQPANEYGRQKVDTERQLLALGVGVTIIRITKVVSPQQAIFATMLKKLNAQESLELFDDLYICPISIDYLCDSITKIMDANLDGIFHVSGRHDLSYAAFARHIAAYLQVDPALVQGIPASNILFKPRYASLSMQRATTLVGLLPEELNIQRMLGDVTYQCADMAPQCSLT